MNDSDKLELIEKARTEFERNVRAAIGDRVHIHITIHDQRLFENAPSEWEFKQVEETRWHQSSAEISHTSVFAMETQS